MTGIRKISLLLVILVFVLSWSAYSYQMAFEDSLTRKDYPFIDLYFRTDDEWLIVDCRNIYTDKEQYWVVKDPCDYEFYKEYFAVDTFPVGRGTTPTHQIYVLKNKQIERVIPYFTVYIEHPIWEDAFSLVEKEMVWDLIVGWYL